MTGDSIVEGDTSQHVSELNVEGLICPEPVMMLHNRINELQKGDVVRVVATDPSTERDIPKFCEFLGHELIRAWEEEKYFLYLIRKGD